MIHKKISPELISSILNVWRDSGLNALMYELDSSRASWYGANNERLRLNAADGMCPHCPLVLSELK